jgi:hypothetical protein
MSGSVTDLKWLESRSREGERPVGKRTHKRAGILSTTGHEKSGGNPGGPPSKAKELMRPIVNQYREGKVKSTPRGG